MAQRTDHRGWLTLKTLGVAGIVGVLTALSATATAQNPPQPSAGGADLAASRALFDRACGRCHPHGEEDVGTRLTGRNDSEAEVRTTVRSGHGRMRAIRVTGNRALSPEDFDNIFPYLRSIRAVSAAVPATHTPR